MTTRTEKLRRLHALARSPNKHEAALALAKAQAMESGTAKAITQAIAKLLEARGMQVRVSAPSRSAKSRAVLTSSSRQARDIPAGL